MRMTNHLGQSVYYNPVEKRGKTRYIVKAISGQTIPGRDKERKQSRTFAQEHQAKKFLQRNGYRAD